MRTLLLVALALGALTAPPGLAVQDLGAPSGPSGTPGVDVQGPLHNDLTEAVLELLGKNCETEDCVWVRLDGSFLDTEPHDVSGQTLYWGPFRVWDEGTDGAGSGLDADVLDGITSGQFLRSDASGNLGGDLTVAGVVSIDSGNRQGLSVVTADQSPYALAIGNQKAPSDLGMFVYDDGTADIRNRGGKNLVFNSAGGPVGVGTSSPDTAYQMHVASPGLLVDDSSGGNGFSVKRSDDLFVRLSSDSTTGFVMTGAGQPLAFLQGGPTGTEVMRLDSNGHVGIGRSNPASAKLEIAETGASEGLRVDGAGGAYALVVHGGTDLSTRMRSASIGSGFAAPPSNGLVVEGKVGIGTSGPGAKLQVEGGRVRVSDASAQGELFSGVSGGLVATHLGSLSNIPLAFYSANSGPRMVLDTSGNVGIGTVSPASKLDVETSADGEIARFRRVGAANNVGLFINADEASGVTTLLAGGSTGGPLAIGTNAAERMRIGATGNVGIGTTNPNQKFVVSNGGAGGLEVVASSNSPIIQAYNRATNSYEAMRIDSAALVFSDGATERVRIDSLGNVGIGTGTPEVDLHVLGSIIAQGTGGEGRVILRGTGTGGHQYEWYPDLPSVGDLHLYDRTVDAVRMVVKSDGRIGIGTQVPSAALDVEGTVRATDLFLTNTGPLGTCGSAERGTLRVNPGSAGVADVLYMCMKSAGDTYAWKAIVTG